MTYKHNELPKFNLAHAMLYTSPMSLARRKRMPKQGVLIMASKSLFQSLAGKLLPKTNTVNSENAPAYTFGDKHALAQLAATGCLNATFYASADAQLETVLKLAGNVAPEFVAKTALYARTKGYMKDMPALLCAVLSVSSPGLMAHGHRLTTSCHPCCPLKKSGKCRRNYIGSDARKSMQVQLLPASARTRWRNSKRTGRRKAVVSSPLLPLLIQKRAVECAGELHVAGSTPAGSTSKQPGP
jgi:hypothetical protein